MVGFFFGVLVAMGAMGMARRRRRWHRYARRHGYGHGCGHGHHPGPCGHGGHHRDRHGFGGEWGDDYSDERSSYRAHGPLGGLFARLETTPAQEREIREALADVKKTARGAKGRMKDLAEDLASAMRQEDLDVDTLGTLLANQDTAIDDVKKELVGALARVHNVLDKDQRERLTRFLERAGPRMRWA